MVRFAQPVGRYCAVPDRRGEPVSAEVINPWSWQEQFGFVHGNVVPAGGRTLYVAGQASVDDQGRPVHEGDMLAQVAKSLDNIEAVLRGAGMSLANVVRLSFYTTDIEAFFGAHDLLVKRYAETGCRPASTLLGVSRLAFPELLVELEATAVG
jgi:enamine deaminase RidA (YjgF/YER057c/UK114 family)